MLDDIDQKTGDFVVNGLLSGVYDDPTKYYQGVHIDTGETMGDFMRWWKSQCAIWDAQPKQIIRSDPDRWSGTKGGKRK